MVTNSHSHTVPQSHSYTVRWSHSHTVHAVKYLNSSTTLSHTKKRLNNKWLGPVVDIRSNINPMAYMSWELGALLKV